MLGVSPEGPDEGYGWIEPAVVQDGQESVAVRSFWEKPDAKEARKLMRLGSLWNTIVFVARAESLWNMVAHADPEFYCIFSTIRLTLPNDDARSVTEFAHKARRPVNFCSAILSKSNAHLRVIRVPKLHGVIGERENASSLHSKRLASLRNACKDSNRPNWKVLEQARFTGLHLTHRFSSRI